MRKILYRDGIRLICGSGFAAEVGDRSRRRNWAAAFAGEAPGTKFARYYLVAVLSALPFLLMPGVAQAQVAVAVADSGDTAWAMICALLVMLAALPGLMLRLAGRVHVRNALAAAAQVAAVAAMASLAWAVAGYSLAYGAGGPWIGGQSHLMLTNLAMLRDGLTIPESAFVLFQMSLAVLAACLTVAAVGERARFGWAVAFAPLWLLIVYAPITHWVWGGGWLAGQGTMDFAGGLVLHGTAGFSALTLALLAGRRDPLPRFGHSPLLATVGGAMMLVGLSGVVGGWALGATDDAATAILNLHFAACTAALSRALLDRMRGERSSATGIMSAGLAGIAAISASAALVGPAGAMAVGVIAALVCYIGMALLRGGRADDAANSFAIHGLGGSVGLLTLPVLVLPKFGGVGFAGDISLSSAYAGQAIGLGMVALWAMVGTAIVALTVSIVLPLRVDGDQEAQGLDVTQHGQQSWDFR